MQATLHLPGVAPRPLTATELAALAPYRQGGYLTLDYAAAAPALAELLGTQIPAEPLAGEENYLIVGAENAADYDFGPTPSADADFLRLTGSDPNEDGPLTGPLLIIED